MKVRRATHLLIIAAVAASAHASKVAAEADDDDGGGAVAWITDSETVVVGNHTERVLHKHRLNVSTHNHDSRAAEEEADDDHNSRGREGGQVFSVIDLIHEKQRQQARGRDARANSMRAMLEEIQMEQAAGQSSGAGSSSSAGPSVEVEVPDEYLCPITSEIMTDPVITVRCCRSPSPAPAADPRSSHVTGGRLHLRA